VGGYADPPLRADSADCDATDDDNIHVDLIADINVGGYADPPLRTDSVDINARNATNETINDCTFCSSPTILFIQIQLILQQLIQ